MCRVRGKGLANVGRMYRVRGKWLANVCRMCRVRAKGLANVWRMYRVRAILAKMAILASTRIRQTGEFSASTRIRQIRRRVAIAY
jgi:hypothetical protein